MKQLEGRDGVRGRRAPFCLGEGPLRSRNHLRWRAIITQMQQRFEIEEVSARMRNASFIGEFAEGLVPLGRHFFRRNMRMQRRRLHTQARRNGAIPAKLIDE